MTTTFEQISPLVAAKVEELSRFMDRQDAAKTASGSTVNRWHSDVNTFSRTFDHLLGALERLAEVERIPAAAAAEIGRAGEKLVALFAPRAQALPGLYPSSLAAARAVQQGARMVALGHGS